MPQDLYRSFRKLKATEGVGVDYRIHIDRRDSPVAIVAPHGGTIEPGTSEIAAAIAGDDFSLYCFEGLQKRRPHYHLHITSTRFDESQCVALVEGSDTVVAVHGLRGAAARVDVGGSDLALRDHVSVALKAAGFDARVVSKGEHAAVNPQNICNRGRRAAGIQLEITKPLRDRLTHYRARSRLNAFANAVRRAVTS
jgi:phage replication-related protein YjqB (UPF0714/DUF867 family)